jgi:DNA-binding NarL/FixJ family response regulator
VPANDLYGTRVPSEREYRVIYFVARGLKNREVASEIGTTEHVVKNYLRVIYDKLGLNNRVELALWHESRRVGPADSEPVSAAPAETQKVGPVRPN